MKFFRDADLQVRAYNWPKNNRQKDKKPSMSDYQERKVEEIKLVTELSLLQLLILEEPFENSVPSINYIDYYSTDVYNMGNKCALVKLKYKDSNVYHKCNVFPGFYFLFFMVDYRHN